MDPLCTAPPWRWSPTTDKVPELLTEKRPTPLLLTSSQAVGHQLVDARVAIRRRDLHHRQKQRLSGLAPCGRSFRPQQSV